LNESFSSAAGEQERKCIREASQLIDRLGEKNNGEKKNQAIIVVMCRLKMINFFQIGKINIISLDQGFSKQTQNNFFIKLLTLISLV
jgi:hypothetical protein